MKEPRAITVQKLRQLLDGLPNEYLVMTNDVGNLVIAELGEKGALEAVGYIDIPDECFNSWDDRE